MKRTVKKSLAIFLAILMLSSSFVCFASAAMNEEAVNKHKGQYQNYLLLGDSAASGYRDEVTDNDYAFNDLCKETTYWRVPGSYADILVNTLGIPNAKFLAAPGYRTIEMRYMLEDDYRDACTDKYLFWTSHLYVWEHETYPGAEGLGPQHPGSEFFRDLFKKSIAEADLISLGIGGNDWGAYLGWVLADIIENEHADDKYIKMIEDLISAGPVSYDTIAKLVEIAHIAGALPTLGQVLPKALNYGLTNFYTNWDYMIQDIYDLNPDVTLMVVGMSDNSLKGKYYDYDGVTGELVNPDAADEDPTKAAITKTIVDFIMGVGNAPMIEGAKKFGYKYVDTDGTTYVESHPDAAGHEFIANRIIEELPDANVSTQFTDVHPGLNNYKDIEFVVTKGIMSGVTEDSFGLDEDLTTGQLNQAINAITGSEKATDSTSKASVLQVAVSLFAASAKKGVTGVIEGFTVFFKIISSRGFVLTGGVSRNEAVGYFRTIAD